MFHFNFVITIYNTHKNRHITLKGGDTLYNTNLSLFPFALVMFVANEELFYLTTISTNPLFDPILDLDVDYVEKSNYKNICQ